MEGKEKMINDMKFRKGDRVESSGRVGYVSGKRKGTVLRGGINCLVEFDDSIGGHDGSNRGKNGHCWYCLGGLAAIRDNKWMGAKR